MDKAKSKNKLRRKFILVPIILFILLSALRVCFIVYPDGFDGPMDYRVAWFGLKYAELYSLQTSKEEEIGNEIAERAAACMEYTGDEALAPETDKLSRFYYFPHYKRPDHAIASVELKKAVIHGKHGSVWLSYTYYRFDENNEDIDGRRDILARCTVKKDNSGEWTVTKVDEPV